MYPIFEHHNPNANNFKWSKWVACIMILKLSCLWFNGWTQLKSNGHGAEVSHAWGEIVDLVFLVLKVYTWLKNMDRNASWTNVHVNSFKLLMCVCRSVIGLPFVFMLLPTCNLFKSSVALFWVTMGWDMPPINIVGLVSGVY
jgi:hypothetical protein